MAQRAEVEEQKSQETVNRKHRVG